MCLRHEFLRTLFLAFVLGLCIPFTSLSQDNDTQQVMQAVEDYVIGWRNGDKELLKKTFDMDAGVVLWVDKKGERERLKSMTLADLANRVKPQLNFGIGYTLQSLEITDGQLAVARVKIPIGNSHYIDVLELQKINGQWKIVLKSFVYFSAK